MSLLLFKVFSMQKLSDPNEIPRSPQRGTSFLDLGRPSHFHVLPVYIFSGDFARTFACVVARVLAHEMRVSSQRPEASEEFDISALTCLGRLHPFLDFARFPLVAMRL